MYIKKFNKIFNVGAVFRRLFMYFFKGFFNKNNLSKNYDFYITNKLVKFMIKHKFIIITSVIKTSMLNNLFDIL